MKNKEDGMTLDCSVEKKTINDKGLGPGCQTHFSSMKEASQVDLNGAEETINTKHFSNLSNFMSKLVHLAGVHI